ncbi:DNA ligase 4 [Ramaria rubella]|nr:DNA ligase 4 [Ramaria rubella]
MPPPSPPLTNVTSHQNDETSYEHDLINKGKYPLFGALTGLYEKLTNENKHEMRRKLLANWFRKWREDVGPNLYPVLRLLLPQKDRERAVYNIKEKTLAKIYIRIIPLNMKDEDAVRLLNWKKPSEKDKIAGDFPMVLFEVISKRSNVMEGTLDIERLNKLLDELAKAGGKIDQQTTIMTTIYNNCTSTEQRWLVRIILKDLIISVKETTVFSVLHEDAMALFNTCSDLKRVAHDLYDPTKRLDADEKTVKLFRAFAPMLCKRPTKRIEDTVKLMHSDTFIIEEKLDGERMQLHKLGNEYFYCSRKGKDYTYLYGKTVREGSLTPYIDKAIDPRVVSIILDGEMLVWDPVTERHLPFGSLKTAALDKSKKELRPRPCFKIFDCLFLNGKSLIHKTLEARKKNMRLCVSEVHGRIEYVQEFEGRTAKDVRARMDEIIENRGEGLILKHPKGQYTLNGRNIDFIKVKPEYMDNMGETVDVLVVAGNWGSGKRGGGVSTLICAVRDDRQSDNEDDEPKYSSFVRIGSGLTFADYVWIRAKPWKPWIKEDPPSFFQTSKKGTEDKGDVYLEPEDSFIIKVKAAEIVTSDQYHLNLTMRFPRALAIRDDLSAEDCLTATALFESLQSVKKRKTSDSGDGQKKRKGNNKKPIVLPQYQGANLEGVDVQSSIFKGMRFQVTPDPKSQTGKRDKHEIETLIHTHGGDYSQLPRADTSLVVYDGITTPPSIAAVVRKSELDVIRSAWIKDSIAKGVRIPFHNRYFFHATKARQREDDYNLDDFDAEPINSTIDEASSSSQPNKGADGAEMQTEGGTHDEWFKLPADESGAVAPDLERPEEETLDYDSDGSHTENGDIDPPGSEEWEIVGKSDTLRDGVVQGMSREAHDADITMGGDSAMEYDQDLLFKHLCFYLDNADNARKNDMAVDNSRKLDLLIEENFENIQQMIIECGGEIVDIDDPKLTHVLYDKRDESRRVQLLRKASKTKRRYVLMTEWVKSSIAEGSLLDEGYFA